MSMNIQDETYLETKEVLAFFSCSKKLFYENIQPQLQVYHFGGRKKPWYRERDVVAFSHGQVERAAPINPEHWTEEIGLRTPTFEALLKADGTLWLTGAALREGFSIEAVQALTRFLSERVKLPPTEPPYDFSDFTPRPVEE